MTKRIIKWTYPDGFEGLDESFIDKQIKKGLIEMAAYFDELIFEGYMDGHHFCIERIINDGESLSREDISELYYIAFAPEAIDINNLLD